MTSPLPIYPCDDVVDDADDGPVSEIVHVTTFANGRTWIALDRETSESDERLKLYIWYILTFSSM